MKHKKEYIQYSVKQVSFEKTVYKFGQNKIQHMLTIKKKPKIKPLTHIEAQGPGKEIITPRTTYHTQQQEDHEEEMDRRFFIDDEISPVRKIQGIWGKKYNSPFGNHTHLNRSMVDKFTSPPSKPILPQKASLSLHQAVLQQSIKNKQLRQEIHEMRDNHEREVLSFLKHIRELEDQYDSYEAQFEQIVREAKRLGL